MFVIIYILVASLSPADYKLVVGREMGETVSRISGKSRKFFFLSWEIGFRILRRNRKAKSEAPRRPLQIGYYCLTSTLNWFGNLFVVIYVNLFRSSYIISVKNKQHYSLYLLASRGTRRIQK